MKISSSNIYELILEIGGDIIYSPGMEYERYQRQHGGMTCFEHSVSVAYISLRLAEMLGVRVNISSLVRGALLHDYFLYDWREGDCGPASHAFTHARTALKNAEADFALNLIERDIIARHMFPLNLTPPKYRESVLVCIADKLSAGIEYISAILPIPMPGETARRSVL